MKMKELEENSFIKKWLSGIAATKETKKSYLQALQLFTEWLKKTPDELILEAEQEIKQGLLLRERGLFTYIPEFREVLENRKLAPLTVKGRVASVVSFYKYNNIPIPALPKSKQKARPELKRREIPDKDALREILKISNPLERAVLLVGVASGLSAIDICNLKVQDVTKGKDPVTGITTIHIIRQKTGYEFYTFLSPEATKAVEDYLNFRSREIKNTNEVRRKQLLKQRITKNEKGNEIGYLFVNLSVPDEFLKTHDEELRHIGQQGFLAIYRRLNERARMNAPKGEYNVVRSHNCRRFFNSALINAGAPQFFVEFWLGHEIDRTREAYYRADPEKLKQEYQRWVPFITIEKELDISLSSEFKQLNEEVQELKGENEKLKLDRFENEAIKKLKEEVEELRKAQKEKEELRKEFEPIFEEERKQREKVEEVTNMDFESALGFYEVAQIMPPDSEELKKFRKRVVADLDFREKVKKATSNKLEKQEMELAKRALKTLADTL